MEGVSELVGVIEAVTDAVADCVGVCVGDAPDDRDGVGDCDGVPVADGVAEHESGTERPVAAHPHAHGSGADDASGQ